MNNKKGQALVEFVIILPIFLFMLLAIIDIGKIVFLKNSLEGQMTNVIELYKNQKTFEDIERELARNDSDILLEIKNENNDKITFLLKKRITIVTPGLSLIFTNPYDVEVKRVMSYG